MKVKFTPKICEQGEYEGHVILKMPSYVDRLSFYENDVMDETTGKPGEEPVTDEEKVLARHRSTKKMRAVMNTVGKRLGEFVVEVHLTRKKDGFVLSTFEHLNYDSDMIAVLTECTERVLGKFEVGLPQ